MILQNSSKGGSGADILITNMLVYINLQYVTLNLCYTQKWNGMKGGGVEMKGNTLSMFTIISNKLF